MFEHVSILLNTLKRLLEYDRVIEALLNRWSSDNWDGLIGPIGAASEGQNFAIALFCQDSFKGLEARLDRLARSYKRPLQSQLFQLNNYNYILRTLRSSRLAQLVPLEVLQKYEQVVDMLSKEFLALWAHVGGCLADTPVATGRGGSVAPRDRLKMFTSEIDEAMGALSGCVVPDQELRNFLTGEIRSIIMAQFLQFYNNQQQLFQQGRTRLDPDTLEHMILDLFQS